jgi:hypothetical protein
MSKMYFCETETKSGMIIEYSEGWWRIAPQCHPEASVERLDRGGVGCSSCGIVYNNEPIERSTGVYATRWHMRPDSGTEAQWESSVGEWASSWTGIKSADLAVDIKY